MRVIICGGGIVGVSVAYFLGRRGVPSTVVERCAIACGASGKGGGFLALDWCDGSPLEALARRSFGLHASLAEDVDGAWGYRRLDTFGGSSSAAAAGGHQAPGLGWLSGTVRVNGRLGSTRSTAQVHPGQFTAALMRAAEAAAAELRRGEVTGIVRNRTGERVAGVMIDGEIVEADAVVVAMGPWSQFARQWLPLPDIFGLKGHSLVFDTGTEVPAEAVFLEHQEIGGDVCSPEIFPRADGTTYVCAISSETPLPVDPADVEPDPGAIERLEAVAASISPALARSRILARQACFRPIMRDGLPLIGPIPGLQGAYVATGHSVWGILNAPATGEAMAELIVDGRARTVALDAFDPARFTPGMRRT